MTLVSVILLVRVPVTSDKGTSFVSEAVPQLSFSLFINYRRLTLVSHIGHVCNFLLELVVFLSVTALKSDISQQRLFQEVFLGFRVSAQVVFSVNFYRYSRAFSVSAHCGRALLLSTRYFACLSDCSGELSPGAPRQR